MKIDLSSNIIKEYYHLRILSSSIFRVSLFLYSEIIIASPTAASAAATVSTIKTKICPLTSPIKEENEIRVRFIALSISSIHIKMIIAFRLTRTPITPTEKRNALRMR